MMDWVVAINASRDRDLGPFLARRVSGAWIEEPDGPLLTYRCTTAQGSETTLFRRQLADALAQYLLIYQKRQWLESLAPEVMPAGYGADMLRAVIDESLRRLHASALDDRRRLREASERLGDFLAESAVIQLDGVRRFLFADYEQLWLAVLAETLQEWDWQREHEEFIQFLQRCISRLPGSVVTLAIRFNETGLLILEDGDGHRVTPPPGYQDRMKGFSDDEWIMLVLRMAPRRLVIHDEWLPNAVKEILLGVYGDGFHWCAGCRRCKPPQSFGPTS
ncbi:hypothetical protein TPY_3549 [Sulfobacillus acidophilus TPY]|uniref:Sporulation protein YtxC n=1 Tax=Sulfobacillus acidophilus (strain ATCC 700253 / DSM 10332 / NAL) TaxID=679936 RepID=G8TWG6_SULAD|nr:hypothetical protein TPY_3549 [Sulfobacillus acidophilus TPY]AEW04864.1 hypothetical protein Sulac_1367 [Sulfobacillus acidophilus DSM 10332]